MKLAIVALIAGGTGWFLGKHRAIYTDHDPAHTTEHFDHYHSHGDQVHSHSAAVRPSQRDEGRQTGDSRTAEEEAEYQTHFPGGGRITKDEYVRSFIETYGELTPELNQVLNEYGTR